MLYIITYIVLTYQKFSIRNLGKFGYKLNMEVKNIYIYIFWLLTNHNLITSDLINFENGKTNVTYISRMKSKKL
jgi:hypothetical protein